MSNAATFQATCPTTSSHMSADTIAKLVAMGGTAQDLGSYTVVTFPGAIVTFEEEAAQVLAPKKAIEIEDDGWDAIETTETYEGWTVKELRAKLLSLGAASDLSETGDYGVAVRGNAIIRRMRRAELVETLNEWA